MAVPDQAGVAVFRRLGTGAATGSGAGGGDGVLLARGARIAAEETPDLRFLAASTLARSAAIPLAQRPAGRRLVAAALAGAFEAVVITRADRLGRDAIDLFIAAMR